MIISCTKKLQDELKIKLEKAENQDLLFSWHANLINVNRRKTIVLVNDATRYCIILYGLKAKDFKRFTDNISEYIKQAMIAELINPEVIDKYISDCGECTLSKTNDRSLISRLNKGCGYAEIQRNYFVDNSIIQSLASKKVNYKMSVDFNNSRTNATELFYEALTKHYGITAFKITAIIMNIRLNFEEMNVWRKVAVPANTTFSDFHKIIQYLFNWKNYHMHEFEILDEEKTVARIVMSKDDIENCTHESIVLESQSKLTDYIPKYKKLLYTYDFGDNWEHIIEIENIQLDYDKNYSSCLDGEGDSPPEDVGGEYGYYDFLDIIKNPSHEDYMETKMWAIGQHWCEFKIGFVNWYLQMP